MTKKFVMVSLSPDLEFDLPAFEQELDKAEDWIQYFPNCWLLRTEETPKQWYRKIQKVIGERKRVFVCEANTSVRGGFMPKSFWNFLTKHSDVNRLSAPG